MTKLERACLIVNEILDDLTDRKGIGNEFESYDEDIQAEITSTWIDLVEQHLE